MVGKSRFGGLFSILSRRDINTIRLVETHIESSPDFESDLALADSDTNLEDMPLDEILDGVRHYIEYLREERGTGDLQSKSEFQEIADWQKDLSSERKVEWAERQGTSRYWEAKLKPIAVKLEKAKNRLENEALD